MRWTECLELTVMLKFDLRVCFKIKYLEACDLVLSSGGLGFDSSRSVFGVEINL